MLSHLVGHCYTSGCAPGSACARKGKELRKLIGWCFHRLILVGALFSLAGCVSLLPSSKEAVDSPWQNYDDAKKNFDEIVPNKTTVKELKALGYDIETTPNLKNLNYLDIASRIQPIPFENLDPGLQDCLRAKDNCTAYVFEPKRSHIKRTGNFWLDFFNFRRISHETGWNFKALVVMVNGNVTYKLWSGTPHVQEYRDLRNPLGPLQGASDLIFKLL